MKHMECQIGLVQMPVSDDKAANLERAHAEIKRAADLGAELVILPEMFCVPYVTARFPDYAEEAGGEAQRMMQNAARDYGIWLVGGSICECEDGRYYNTSYVYNDKGECVAKHRKAHLFDIDIEGGQYFKESDVLSAGDGATVFDSPWGKIGLGICFDIRFTKQADAMIDSGARMLVYPAAFNMTTGPRHWELLFRARAVDGQCVAIGVAPARNTESSYVSWGHTIVVNPWGVVEEDLGTEAVTKVVRVALDTVGDVRRQIPLGRK